MKTKQKKREEEEELFTPPAIGRATSPVTCHIDSDSDNDNDKPRDRSYPLDISSISYHTLITYNLYSLVMDCSLHILPLV